MKISLNSLPLSGKIAVSLFLILLWYGYFLAALNARLAVGTSVSSIAEHYSDKSLTKDETKKLNEQGFTEEEVDINGGHDHQAAGNSGEENETISPQELVQLGHIHILGFSLLFISIGTVLFLSGIGEWIKTVILFLLFLSFSLDIGGLFLVRFVSDNLAFIPFVSAVGIGGFIAIISLIAFYDMWIRSTLGPKGTLLALSKAKTH